MLIIFKRLARFKKKVTADCILTSIFGFHWDSRDWVMSSQNNGYTYCCIAVAAVGSHPVTYHSTKC